jgi:hypothetical protein
MMERQGAGDTERQILLCDSCTLARQRADGAFAVAL